MPYRWLRAPALCCAWASCPSRAQARSHPPGSFVNPDRLFQPALGRRRGACAGAPRRPLRAALAGCVLLAAAVAAGAGAHAATPAHPAAASAPGAPLVVGLPDFTRLVKAVGPSVVNIRTYTRSAEQGTDQDAQTREFLRRFFGLPRPPGDSGRAPPAAAGDEHPAGVGSGFILEPDGYVLTNAHVVDGADRIVVTLMDRREFVARLVGADPRTDVALLRIAAHGLPAVRIGDATRLQVGEWVVAIGSPFGLDNTVTAGIVSAKARDTGEYTPLIQTDVAVNPGNSGGPLIDMYGRVVGMNSQIYSRTGGFMGISFAIPVNQVVAVAEQLKASGHVVRGRIGVAVEPLERRLARSLGLDDARGALVGAVEPGGAAAVAGVLPGDIILSVDGHAVERSSDLPRLVGAIRPGSRIPLQVFRLGHARTLQVTVGAWQSPAVARRMPSTSPAARSRLGIGVVDLNAAQREQLGVGAGVMVESTDGFGAAAGLRVGDVITALNNTPSRTASQFSAQVDGLPRDKAAVLLIRRGPEARYLLLHPRKISE